MDLWDGVLFVIVLLHQAAAPYTKVEESFNLQATHDILFHGTNISQYDHLEFPGVVPRTFLGPLLLALACSPLRGLQALLGFSKWWLQPACRAILGLWTTMCIARFRRSFAKIFGPLEGRFLVLLCCVQFHLPFYASRTLPNTFALCLVLRALAAYLEGDVRWTVLWMAPAGLVFRSELVLLAGPLLCEWLVSARERRRVLAQACGWGLVGTACVLPGSVLLDSLLWRRLLWPELEVLLFNTWENQSHRWGVSPWHWYLTSALPRALQAALPLAALALLRDPRRLAPLLRPVFAFVALYSLLPHKELRFIFPAIVPLNAAAACTLAAIWRWSHSLARRGRKRAPLLPLPLPQLGALFVVGLLTASALVSAALLAVSSRNYPGGYAFAALHRLEAARTNLRVHIDVEAAMTGVSRFGELRPDWTYSKEEDLRPDEITSGRFTHLLTANATLASTSPFCPLHAESAFAGIAWSRGPLGLPWPELLFRNTIFVAVREDA
jgi:alpha-1,6-mannosyltransferase